ncbi:DUF2336 domain-containing protein [Sphingomonas sp. RB1R13]|uniref:DUF2336 domain-containing protein n=1 Tax=Sphingomonas sp. RB1R13 TaxID=3096159 RepID=UPI002FC6FCD1
MMMMSEEWPIAARAADRPVDPARRAGWIRLDTVRRDFFLDPAARLSEQERALMTTMLDDLVSTIADELVAGLTDGLDSIAAEGHDALIARLWSSGLLDRPVLVSLLLRRADEQRLAANLQLRQQPGRPPLVQRWVADSDGELAACAMALVIARGRRRDRYGQGRLLFDDLPAEEAVAVVNAVAAGIRQPLPAHPGIDRALAAGAGTLLSRHDENQRIDAMLAALVRMLERAGRLDDALVADAAAEGETALLAAILARRGGLPEDRSWDHLIAGGEGRLVLLARLAGLARPTAARLVADLGALTGIADPAAEMAMFDQFGEEAVEDRRGEWRLPASYRDARRVLRNG